MQHAIGLQQPSGLIGHQIQQIAPRLRRGLLPDRLPTDGIERSCAIWIHQCRRVVHLHLCCQRSYAKRHRQMHRHFRANLHQLAPWRESLRMQTQPVNPERQILRHVSPVRAYDKRPPELVCLASQFAGRRHRRALCVAHFNAQLSAHALRLRVRHVKKEKRKNSYGHPCVSRKHFWRSKRPPCRTGQTFVLR